MDTSVASLSAASVYLRSMLEGIMERFRSALEPWEDGPLPDDFATFVEAGSPNRTTSFSSVVRVLPPPGALGYSVTLKRRGGRGGRGEEVLTRTFHGERLALQAVRTLIACPSWTHAEFEFCYLGSETLVERVFSLLRSSCSLAALDIRLDNLYSRFLPTLLCENPFLETLVLDSGAFYNREDAERLALCFSRNSVLRSCTLVVNSARLRARDIEVALEPFMNSSKCDANFSLKELVVREEQELVDSGVSFGKALANLVRCNTTLEKLEFRFSYPDLYLSVAESLPGALADNHTLEEFRCNCTVAVLNELVRVLIPDSSGHQANMHVTTLKLVPTLNTKVDDFMKELSRMLEANSTLRHVEVVVTLGISSNSNPRVWEVRAWKPPQCPENVSTQDMLELMMRNELRLNTSLQSLIVGCWKLLRVGGEWQMSYGGPCLASELLLQTGEYDVKVRMR